MTVLRRVLARETPVTIRDGGRLRQIVLEMRPGDPSMYLRQKGSRHRYALPYEAAYIYAVKLAVDQAKREKAKAKRESRCH